jgi:hypothetical protein
MKATKKVKRGEDQGRILGGTMAWRGTSKRPFKVVLCDIYAGPSLTGLFREPLVEQLSSE